MRTFLVLICSLALACAAGGAQKEDKSKKQAPKKSQAQSSQHSAAPAGGLQRTKGSQHGTTAHHASGSYSARVGSTVGPQKTNGPQRVDGQTYQLGPKMEKTKGSQHVTTAGTGARKTKEKTKGSQQVATQSGQATGAGKSTGAGKPHAYSASHYSLESSTRTGKRAKVGKTTERQAAGGGAQKTKGPRKIAASGGNGSHATYQQMLYSATDPNQIGKTKTKGSQQTVTQRGQAATGHGLGLDHNLVNKSNYVTKYKAKHFNLSVNTRPTTITGVTFQQNRRIGGSQNWQGQNYWAFRTYTPVRHERNWWNSHYNRIVFVFGGWYYWDDFWWRPAWGYAPNAYYAYDGPIYAYNDLPPDQVVANVQAALQEQGYYQGEVDGLLGPLTRTALADYQRDHGLYETAAIDRPTLEFLGMA